MAPVSGVLMSIAGLLTITRLCGSAEADPTAEPALGVGQLIQAFSALGRESKAKADCGAAAQLGRPSQQCQLAVQGLYGMVSLRLENGDLSCEQGPLYMRAKPVFARAADVLKRAARAKAGPQPAVVAELAQCNADSSSSRRSSPNHVVAECKGPNDVALNTIRHSNRHSQQQVRDSQHSNSSKPSKEEKCSTAQKLLKAYERLFPKVNRGKRLDPKRIEELNKKRNNGTITSNDTACIPSLTHYR